MRWGQIFVPFRSQNNGRVVLAKLGKIPASFEVSSKISGQEENFMMVVERTQGAVNDMSLENKQRPPRQEMGYH